MPRESDWNEFLEKLHIEKGQLKFVENNSENPDINYSKNYIKGVEQLESLMETCQAILPKITCPTLIIQSDKDLVINSKSSKAILEKINSQFLIFKEIDSSKHIIVKGQGSEKVFKIIEEFLSNRT